MSGPTGAELPGAFPRIDAHQHFTPSYLPSLLLPILRRNRFDGSVVVTALPSVQVTRWLLSLASEYSFIRAVVGGVDLADPRLGELLDEYQRHPKFRGGCYAFAWELPPGLAELDRRGLTLDVSAGFTLAIAERFPGLRVAIDGVGTARVALPPSVAQYPNVFAKISGLITHAPTGWKAALAAFTQAIGPQTLETREHLLGGTARRFYRLETGNAA